MAPTDPTRTRWLVLRPRRSDGKLTGHTYASLVADLTRDQAQAMGLALNDQERRRATYWRPERYSYSAVAEVAS